MQNEERLIGVRELKERASQILKQVREDGADYYVTYHGRVVARLIPVSPVGDEKDASAVWADLDQLAAEIGKSWPANVNAEEAVHDVRREL